MLESASHTTAAACGVRHHNNAIHRKAFHMKTEFLNPPTLPPTFGWTQVVTATGGRTIHVSGQASLNERGELIGKGDLGAQTEQTFKNLALALQAVGASFGDVVKMNLYVVGFRPEQIGVIREVRNRYVSADRPPASTLVGVQALVNPDWLIEIDVTAVVAE
jgi:enamine deaminase RidA (YjgF/YER057c/UK114 family)